MATETNNPLSEEKTKNVTEIFLQTVMNNDSFAVDDRDKLSEYVRRNLPDFFLSLLSRMVCDAERSEVEIKKDGSEEIQYSQKLEAFLAVVLNNFPDESQDKLKNFAQKKQTVEFLCTLENILQARKDDRETLLHPNVNCVTGQSIPDLSDMVKT